MKAVFRRWATHSRLEWPIAIISALYILLVYSNGIELISSAGGLGSQLARFVIYLVFIVSIGASCAYVATVRVKSRSTLLLLGYVALLSWVVVYHVIFRGEGAGLATKSFIAGMFEILGFGLLLGLRPARRTVDICVILVLIGSCLLSLGDVLLWGNFSEIPGRGAGLYRNPNLAALAILLGTLGVIGSFDRFWRLPILSVFLLGLFASVSRSGLFVASSVGMAGVPAVLVDLRKQVAVYRRGAIVATIILASGILYLTCVYISGSPFVMKMKLAVNGGAVSSLTEMARQATSEPLINSIGENENSDDSFAHSAACASWKVVFQGLKRAGKCAWLDLAVIQKQEVENSIAARSLLALRNIAAIFDAPWLGSGLDNAFSLRPHNTYLLFTISYGVIGALFLPAFAVFVCLRMGGWRPALPLLGFILSASLFSHDLFLSRDLVAGLAIVLSSSDRRASMT